MKFCRSLTALCGLFFIAAFFVYATSPGAAPVQAEGPRTNSATLRAHSHIIAGFTVLQ